MSSITTSSVIWPFNVHRAAAVRSLIEASRSKKEVFTTTFRSIVHQSNEHQGKGSYLSGNTNGIQRMRYMAWLINSSGSKVHAASIPAEESRLLCTSASNSSHMQGGQCTGWVDIVRNDDEDVTTTSACQWKEYLPCVLVHMVSMWAQI